MHRDGRPRRRTSVLVCRRTFSAASKKRQNTSDRKENNSKRNQIRIGKLQYNIRSGHQHDCNKNDHHGYCTSGHHGSLSQRHKRPDAKADESDRIDIPKQVDIREKNPLCNRLVAPVAALVNSSLRVLVSTMLNMPSKGTANSQIID